MSKAQEIVNRGIQPGQMAEALRLIPECTRAELLEALAIAAGVGTPADGVVHAINAELQRQIVDAQIVALQSTAADQIEALGEVEKTSREQIGVMHSLETNAAWLAVVGILVAVVGVGVAIWDRVSPPKFRLDTAPLGSVELDVDEVQPTHTSPAPIVLKSPPEETPETTVELKERAE